MGGHEPTFRTAPGADPAMAKGVGNPLAAAQPTDAARFDGRNIARLYVSQRTALASLAYRYLSNPHDVDDVVQEAFLRACIAMPELQSEAAACAYLRRTVSNLCIDRLRRPSNKVALQPLESAEAQVDLSSRESVDEDILAAEDAVLVRMALAKLSTQHRQALVAWEVEGATTQEISRRLDIDEVNVKHVLHRARRALRALLTGTPADPRFDSMPDSTNPVGNTRSPWSKAAALTLILLLVGLGTVIGNGINSTDPAPAAAGSLAAAGLLAGASAEPAAPTTPGASTLSRDQIGADREGSRIPDVAEDTSSSFPDVDSPPLPSGADSSPTQQGDRGGSATTTMGAADEHADLDDTGPTPAPTGDSGPAPDAHPGDGNDRGAENTAPGRMARSTVSVAHLGRAKREVHGVRAESRHEQEGTSLLDSVTMTVPTSRGPVVVTVNVARSDTRIVVRAELQLIVHGEIVRWTAPSREATSARIERGGAMTVSFAFRLPRDHERVASLLESGFDGPARSLTGWVQVSTDSPRADVAISGRTI